MGSIRALLVILAISIILPQTITVVQMGLDALHGGHLNSAPTVACENTLPCLWAHQPAMPPAAKTIEQLVNTLMVLGAVVFGSMLVLTPQHSAIAQHRIRQLLYNRVGLHMHAFDGLRFWIAQGMLGQKVTEVLA